MNPCIDRVERVLSIELILTTGSKAGTAAPIQRGYYLIGRHAECQIRPKSRSVSRRHCLLHHGEQGLGILDLRSTRGTHVNDTKIQPQTWTRLHHGDQIRCGKVTFDVAIRQLALATATATPAAGVATDAWQENEIADFLESADDAEREQRYGQIKAGGQIKSSGQTQSSDWGNPSEQDDGDLGAYADTPLEQDDSTPLESTAASNTKSKAKAKPRRRSKPAGIPHKKRREPKRAGERFSFSFAGIGQSDRWKLLGAVALVMAFSGFFSYQLYRYSSGPEIQLLEQID